jgi:hypothetical protein
MSMSIPMPAVASVGATTALPAMHSVMSKAFVVRFIQVSFSMG